MYALEVKDVTFSYDNQKTVLKNINITLNKGELVSLLGVSGGGKTTLFNVIAGLLFCDSAQNQRQGYIVLHRAKRQEHVLLQHVADLAGLPCDVCAVHEYLTLLRLI